MKTNLKQLSKQVLRKYGFVNFGNSERDVKEESIDSINHQLVKNKLSQLRTHSVRTSLCLQRKRLLHWATGISARSPKLVVEHHGDPPADLFWFFFFLFFFFRKYSSFPVSRLTTTPIVNNPIFNSGVHRFSISSTLKRKKSSTMSSFLQHWCEYYNALTKRNRFPQQRLTFWKRIQEITCSGLVLGAGFQHLGSTTLLSFWGVITVKRGGCSTGLLFSSLMFEVKCLYRHLTVRGWNPHFGVASKMFLGLIWIENLQRLYFKFSLSLSCGKDGNIGRTKVGWLETGKLRTNEQMAC